MAESESCWYCGEPIPSLTATRCNKCTAYRRGWRKSLPLLSTMQMLAVLAALVSAIVAFVPFAITQCTNVKTRNSHTAVEFAGVDARNDEVRIYAHLWNTGRQPSTVSGYHLRLAPIHAADVNLLPVMDDNHEVRSVVPAAGEVTVPLLVRGVQGDAAKMNEGLNQGAKVTLCADIVESNRNRPCVESLPFDAELLRDVIERRLVRN
jgi:hypothetical protein